MHLRKITAATVYEVCRLSTTLSAEQRNMVEDNGISIAEAHFSDTAWFRGIYHGDEPIGFLMLDLGMEPDQPGVYLWRFMIAGPHQGKGYGRRALELVSARLRARGTHALYTSYVRGPGSPESFYRAIGFEPTGRLLDHETEAVLRW
ncbi:GNAT family N-acetyltransferase [Nocardia yamanashiensis]|uniref:GNAT family N-acetyltransferase n=1 Tax=Nocardia yamanashiensis TaxID=209247 RepID=UPI001E3F5161|nr:GNAT family N-acetyltransferase [Nocardia yamanashiensis]UGT41248.1 GNAT family N-acetyltransferase [Nocardia yamanashiensis]